MTERRSPSRRRRSRTVAPVEPRALGVGAPADDPRGLLTLIKPGRLTELLFLLELSTHPSGRLRPIAERLGVSVQTISLLHRKFRKEGKVAVVGGRYRATPAGIAELHARISGIRADLDTRMAELQLVRECRAIAAAPIRRDEPVVLFMAGGDLHARPGTEGASRGVAVRGVRRGELVEVERLQGVLPLPPARLVCLVVPGSNVASSARLLGELRKALGPVDAELLAAEGIEAVHALRRATSRPFVRFGVAAAAREAVLLGVPAAIVVSDSHLRVLLQRLAEPSPAVPVEVRTIPVG